MTGLGDAPAEWKTEHVCLCGAGGSCSFSAVRRNYDYVPELGNRKVPPKGKFLPLGDD